MFLATKWYKDNIIGFFMVFVVFDFLFFLVCWLVC